MVDLPATYSTGTVTVTTGGTVVTGSGTSWLNALRPDDQFFNPATGLDMGILSVNSDTQITLKAGWPGAGITAGAYEVRIVPDTARIPERAREILDRMTAFDANNQGLFYRLSTNTDINTRPGAGFIRLDNATLGSVTGMALDNIDANKTGRNVSNIIGTWDIGTLFVIRSLETTAYVSYQMASQASAETNFRKVASGGLVFVGSDGLLGNGEQVSVAWYGVGEGLQVDAIGTFAQRSSYAGQLPGFMFLSTNGDGTTNVATLYQKTGIGDVWSGGARLQGVAGNTGWSPRFGVATDSARRVLQLVTWVGGGGTPPTGAGQYVGTAGLVPAIADAVDIRGSVGATGTQGNAGPSGTAGWSPVLAPATDGDRIVMQLTDWVGGTGAEPTDFIGQYLTLSGYTSTIGDAIDFRGLQGVQGDPGIDGTDPGVLYVWSTSTVDENPPPGTARASAGALAGAFTFFISKTNRAGNDVAAWLLSLGASTSPIKGSLTLTKSGGSAQVVANITGVTDATGYVKIAVSNAAGVTNFDNNDAISIQFNRAGDKGADGAGTGNIIGSGTSNAGEVLIYTSNDGIHVETSGLLAIDLMSAADNLSTVASPTASFDNLNGKGADIASAATINLETATGSFVEITGTANATAISLGEGHHRMTRAKGGYSVTLGTLLKLNTGQADGTVVTFAIGDFVLWIGDAGGLVRGFYFPLAGGTAGVNQITKGGTGAITPITAKDALSVKGTDVASAATINLDTATGDVVTVTGTTSITAVTLTSGKQRLVRFSSDVTLTTGSALAFVGFPSGMAILIRSGSFVHFFGDGATVRGMLFPNIRGGDFMAIATVINP